MWNIRNNGKYEKYENYGHCGKCMGKRGDENAANASRARKPADTCRSRKRREVMTGVSQTETAVSLGRIRALHNTNSKQFSAEMEP